MVRYLKIKKRKIILTFMLIFNQLLLTSYALNIKQVEISDSKGENFSSKYGRKVKSLISSKKKKKTNLNNQEQDKLEGFAEDLDKFVEETFDANNVDNLKNKQEYDAKFDSVGGKTIDKNIKKKGIK